MTRRVAHGIRTCCALVLPTTISSVAFGQAIWTNLAGGDWLSGSNWSIGAAPGPTESAVFGLNAPEFYDVALEVPVSIARLDVGRDRARLVLGEGGSLSISDPLAVRLGLGLSSAQQSRLQVVGGAVETKNVLVGLVAGTYAEVELSGAAGWQADGSMTLGLGGGSASLIVRDGSSLYVAGSLLHLVSFSSELPLTSRFIGEGTTATVAGDLTTTAAINLVDIWDGADVLVNGDVHIIAHYDNPIVDGLDIKGEGSTLTVGGALDIGGGLWGLVRVRDGGHLSVGDVLAGMAPQAPASRLEVNGGMVEVRGDVLLGSTPSAPSGSLDNNAGVVTVAGTIQTFQPGQLGSVAVSGPSMLSGDVEIRSTWIESAVTLRDGGVLEAAGVTIEHGGFLEGARGTVIAPVVVKGIVTTSINPNGAVFTLDVVGSLDLAPSALNLAVLSNVPLSPLVRLQEVTGVATIGGKFRAEVGFDWWNGPRRPVEILHAMEIVGTFSSVDLTPPPNGPPLELKQTATTVRLQADFAADLDDDGLVDASDLGILLGAWGSPESPADLNGDGRVDGADLAQLLASWNAPLVR